MNTMDKWRAIFLLGVIAFAGFMACQGYDSNSNYLYVTQSQTDFYVQNDDNMSNLEKYDLAITICSENLNKTHWTPLKKVTLLNDKTLVAKCTKKLIFGE